MPNEEVDALIEQLRQRIRLRGLSEASVARKLDISRQRLNQWMHGEARPNLEAYLKIKEFLGRPKRGPRILGG